VRTAAALSIFFVSFSGEQERNREKKETKRKNWTVPNSRQTLWDFSPTQPTKVSFQCEGNFDNDRSYSSS